MGNSDSYLGLFNTREAAIIIWFLIFLVWAITQKKIRDAIHGVGKAFLNIKILSIFITSILYSSLIVLILSELGIWKISLIKDTVFWFIGTAFVLLINADKASQDSGYFKKILVDNLKLVLVLEFVVNLYTFNLLIEIILVPFLVVISVLSAYAGTKKEYLPVKKVVDYALSVYGFILLFYAFAKIIGDYRNFATSENMHSFILSPLLTFAYIPFLYLFALMMKYEYLFLRIGYYVKDNRALNKYAKRKIFILCRLNLRMLNHFSRTSMPELLNVNNKEDINNIIAAFKTNHYL